ncbi:MAG TPA: serine protease, partial [Bacteroidales bacterium]|nr:serine protease [Bacteroidales bacterium]
LFVKGVMEMESPKHFAPNANSTIRYTYGQVKDYKPKDGITYNNFTTLEGIISKEDNTSWEFTVPEKLKELYRTKDYGQYGVNGTVPVAFITNNDITGGNSGSPVMNAKGELIGIAFDGNWEAMSGNITFNPDLQRCINVDIRYVLFIIDKFAGAKNLINEMKIVK